jgi:hypothetical protein
MAKKKRSAALFEVMVKQEQRRLPQPPGMFRTLYLWFKNRPKSARAPVSVISSVSEREDVTEPVITQLPAPILREVESVPPPPERAPVYEEPRSTPVAVQRHGGWLALRMSYGTAMITVFALATVVICAFLIGKRWQNRPQTVLASNTTPELRRQAPRPNLTDVRRVSVPPTVAYSGDPPDVMAGNAAATAGTASGNAPARPKERELGFNYVLIQSYPEEKMAVSAAAALRQNGIDCTVEKDIPRFFKYSVVGQIGFSRISNNPQLEAYMNKIRAISDAYAKKPNSFVAFKPQPIKWQAWQRKAD